eukprot:3581672-Prymnesium_polylepis.1
MAVTNYQWYARGTRHARDFFCFSNNHESLLRLWLWPPSPPRLKMNMHKDEVPVNVDIFHMLWKAKAKMLIPDTIIY